MIITRCPACLTAFRVSPEQLARRNGRVRCGHCYRPFDAQAHRIADDALDDPTLPPVIQSRRQRADAQAAPEPAARPDAPRIAPPAEAPPRPAALPELDFELPQPPAPAPEPEPEPEPEPTPESDRLTEPEPPPAAEAAAEPAPLPSEPPPETPPDAPPRWAALGESAATRRESRYRRPGGNAHQTGDDAQAPAPDDTSLEHWRQNAYAPPGAPVRQRWLWALCIGILLGTLAAQASYIWREPITREFPQLRPLYLEACARLGCDVPLARVSGLLAIEHANMDFSAEHSAFYELQAVLHNRAPHPQQLPHIELTLTDLDDQPVLRRALTPSEWLPEGKDATDGIAADERIRIALPFAVRDLKGVAGFRVVAFYP